MVNGTSVYVDHPTAFNGGVSLPKLQAITPTDRLLLEILEELKKLNERPAYLPVPFPYAPVPQYNPYIGPVWT